jgi:hypothetical protein
VASVRGDTGSIVVRLVTVEWGRLDWDARMGLQRRVRHLGVETSVPAGGRVPQPVRTRLEQDVRLERVSRAGTDCP